MWIWRGNKHSHHTTSVALSPLECVDFEVYTLKMYDYVFMQIFGPCIISDRFIFISACTEFFQICNHFNLMNHFSLLYPPKINTHIHTNTLTQWYPKLGHLITSYYAYSFVFWFYLLYQNLQGFWKVCYRAKGICAENNRCYWKTGHIRPKN